MILTLDNLIGFIVWSVLGTLCGFGLIHFYTMDAFLQDPEKNPHGKTAARKVAIGFGLFVGFLYVIIRVNHLTNLVESIGG
jgi:hypothetical protein